MKTTEKAQTPTEKDFGAYARKLFDDGVAAPVIAGLLRDGCFDRIAELVALAPLNGSQGFAACGENFYESKRLSECDRRIKIYVSECERAGIAEREYISVIIAAQGRKKGALALWRSGANKYITSRARDDFDFVCDCIDKYDKKYAGYSILFDVSPQRAAKRLVNKLLCEKHIDKASIRDVLMDYPHISNELIAMYDGADAKTRAEIAKLLKVYKNDKLVDSFLTDTVSKDGSKTVRGVLAPARKYSDNGVRLFEGMMISQSPIPVAMFYELSRSSDSVRDVADRIFFYRITDSHKEVLTFDDGKFFDLSDRETELGQGDDLYVLHPLVTPEYARDILNYGVEQPFLQLRRPVYKIKADERTFVDHLTGTMIDRDVFDKNAKRIGFVFASKRSDSHAGGDAVLYTAGDHAVMVKCDLPTSARTAGCGRISFLRASDIIKIKRSVYVRDCKPVSLRELSPVTYSELAYAVHRLFGVE